MPDKSGSQTLSRGIRMLEILAATGRTLSIDELAGELSVHRSVAYRLLRTLEDHHLVVRDAAGRIALSAGLAALASGVSRDLQHAARPELQSVANDLGMTCLLAITLDASEAITLISAAPEQSVAVAYRPGHRHPLTRGGPGKAILLARPMDTWPKELRAELALSRARGYAVSRDEVVPSLCSVAVPLAIPGQPLASLAVIHVTLPRPENEIARRLDAAAAAVAHALGA